MFLPYLPYFTQIHYFRIYSLHSTQRFLLFLKLFYYLLLALLILQIHYLVLHKFINSLFSYLFLSFNTTFFTIFEIIFNQTINNNNTINNNQKFNINVFLNEQCKDAINFSDFIENIQLSHEDLRNNAQLGFVQGMTKIINDNLNQLTLYQRPLHCTDKKRETMYIRDEDAWNKEKEKAKKKIFEGIQELSRKGIQELMEWKNINPEYNNMDSNFSKFCMAVQKETLAGENREKYYKKVLNNIQETTHLTSNE